MVLGMRRQQNHDATVSSLLTSFLIQGITLVSGVLLARILGPEERGTFQVFALIPLALTQLGMLGLPQAVTYYIAREPAAAGAIIRGLTRTFWTTGLGLMGLQALLLGVLVLNDSAEIQLVALLVTLAIPGSLCLHLGLAILQGKQEFQVFNLLRTSYLFLYAVALVPLFLVGPGDIVLTASAWTGSYLLGGLVTLAVALRSVQAETRKETFAAVAEIRRFGRRSVGGSLNPIETLRLDQFIVAIFVGPVALGLYVVGLSFTNLPRFVAQSIGNVAYPKIAAESQGQLRTAFRFMLLTAGACGVILLVMQAAIGWAVPFFFGVEFSGAIGMARILLLSAFLFSMRRVLNDCVRGMGRPEWGAIAEVTSWVALLPGLALLLPASGAEGAAWALVAASAVGLCVLSYLTIRNQGAPGVKVSIDQPEAVVPAA